MRPNASQEKLERALSDLPGLDASEGFTDRVLTRLDGQDRGSGFARRRPAALAWALLAASIVVALSITILLPSTNPSRHGRPAAAEPPSSPSDMARAARLRDEHRRLREDLQALRALIDENPPVLYLGGDDRVDLVLDLLPVAEPGEVGRLRPALANSAAGNRG